MQIFRRSDFGLNFEIGNVEVEIGGCSRALALWRIAWTGYGKRCPKVVVILTRHIFVLSSGDLFFQQCVVPDIEGAELVSLQHGVEHVIVRTGRSHFFIPGQAVAHGE